MRNQYNFLDVIIVHLLALSQFPIILNDSLHFRVEILLYLFHEELFVQNFKTPVQPEKSQQVHVLKVPEVVDEKGQDLVEWDY